MKLSELNQETTVHHTIYGKGEVFFKNDSYRYVNVLFANGSKISFMDTGKANIESIFHLYIEPVTVIAESEVTRLKELIKAQKELISATATQFMGEVSEMYEHADYVNKLRNKIKELENQAK